MSSPGPKPSPLISLEETRRIIRENIRPLPAVASPLADALGATLAEDATASDFHPAADLSTMDGYVIRPDESPGIFHVVGEIAAGSAPEHLLLPGQSFRIFTGAPLPENGGRVVMQEDTTRDGNSVNISAFRENLFIRRKGSEAKPGDVILNAGKELGAGEISILAQLGIVSPSIVRRPVIRHIATGDELVSPDLTPGPGQIRDTNSSLLSSLLRPFGAEFHTSRSGDDPSAISSLADTTCDLLLLSGGASVGDRDFGAKVLRDLGFTIHFDRLNLRPGKPLIFATRGSQAAFVIPGNPVSHFVTFQVAIRLAIELLCGLTPKWPLLFLEADGNKPSPDPRDSFMPAVVSFTDGKPLVRFKDWSTSGNSFTLAGANALVRVHAGSPPGGPFETLLLDLP